MSHFVHGNLFSRGTIVVGTREGEDFLVKGCSQSDGAVVASLLLLGFVQRVNGRGELAETVLDPAVEDAGIPG